VTSSRTGTGTGATRVLGLATLAMFVALLAFGLFNSPADAVQRDSVRILYLHVPAAEMAYVAFIVAAVSSAAYLWKRTRSRAWDRVASASVELGVVLTGITLATGMMWGRISWGVYWDWADARLVSTLLLFVMFLGYLAVRRLDGNDDQRARRSAVVCLVAILDVPLVHYSVEWFQTTHPVSSLETPGAIDGTFRFLHFWGLVTFLLGYVWLMMHANRIAMLEDKVAGEELAVAIAERQREGVVPGPSPGAAGLAG
jgi:heme exporter protein C